MPYPIRDDAELWRVFDYARTHPDQWNQDTWYLKAGCNTTMCLAGHKAISLDGRQLFDATRVERRDGSIDSTAQFVVNEYDEVEHIHSYAGRTLGLTRQEESALFFARDGEVKTVVTEILNNVYREAAS